jgi:hypothetical protein
MVPPQPPTPRNWCQAVLGHARTDVGGPRSDGVDCSRLPRCNRHRSGVDTSRSRQPGEPDGSAILEEHLAACYETLCSKSVDTLDQAIKRWCPNNSTASMKRDSSHSTPNFAAPDAAPDAGFVVHRSRGTSEPGGITRFPWSGISVSNRRHSAWEGSRESLGRP